MASIPAQFADYQGRKVLVVGGDGFIGYNCCRLLATLGAEVTLISRHEQSRAARFGARVLRLDIGNRDVLASAVDGQEIVLDCVGATGAVDSNADPYRNFDIECRPHMNLFDACARASRPPVMVFLSSRLVYGRASELPVRETHRLAPASFYAVHKVTLENYLEVFGRTHDLPFVILRVANPYGPGPAELDKGYGVINQFIARALDDTPIRVYGDGSQLRDYVYIDDLVRAILAVAPRADCHGEIYNVGSGQGISIAQAIEAIVDACDSRSTVEHVPWPEMALKVETGDFIADIAKLGRVLGGASMTPFREGVAATVAATRAAAGCSA